ncbi:MAG TPA: hypothetical protein VMM76_21640 [Pirellulaceae bacterium]|nr:hypothetical protein [Pirellulaceae bacterium]
MPDYQQPPLRPHWAIVFTIAACPVGLALAVLAHYFLYASWQQALGWWAVMAYLATAFPWSALEWPTRNAAVRGHNAFVITAICITFVLGFVHRMIDPRLAELLRMRFIAGALSSHFRIRKTDRGQASAARKLSPTTSRREAWTKSLR